jgi:hypothetical protein
MTIAGNSEKIRKIQSLNAYLRDLKSYLKTEAAGILTATLGKYKQENRLSGESSLER